MMGTPVVPDRKCLVPMSTGSWRRGAVSYTCAQETLGLPSHDPHSEHPIQLEGISPNHRVSLCIKGKLWAPRSQLKEAGEDLKEERQEQAKSHQVCRAPISTCHSKV